MAESCFLWNIQEGMGEKTYLLPLSCDLKPAAIRLSNIKIHGCDSTFILESNVGRSQADHTQALKSQ